jgi:hypothetical protein
MAADENFILSMATTLIRGECRGLMSRNPFPRVVITNRNSADIGLLVQLFIMECLFLSERLGWYACNFR